MTIHDDYAALTPDELEAMTEASTQLPGEDATSWAARSARLAADYKALAAKRASETVAEPETGEASE